jgi:hypothetical protein
MSRGTAFARRADTGGAKQTAKSLAAEREAFLFAELFAQMVIIEACVAGAGQVQDALTDAQGQAAVVGTAAVGVMSQSRCAAQPVASLRRLICRGDRSSSSAALAHAK